MNFSMRLKRALCIPPSFTIVSSLTLLILVFLPGLVFTPVTTQAKSVHHATILWDSWGVPHIFANNNEDLFYAFGYAQMNNHADLLLKLYGQARGRAAEYWGADYLSSDELVQTMGFPEQATQWYNAQTPEFRRYIDAFVAGINAFAADQPQQIAAQYKVVLPIQATDVFAHGERVLADFLIGDCGASLNISNSAGIKGSNGWAIGPAHSASKQAILLANPHLAWSDEDTFFEAQLTSPSVHTYGSALVGFPVLAIAFNDYLSWTHTVNTIDACDRYALTLAGNGYLFDGKQRAFDTHTQTLRILQPDGTMQQEQLVVRRSVQGPVFSMDGKGPDTQLVAIRLAGVEQFPVYGIWQEWWDMGRARNLAEFQNALSRLQIPMFTVIYADRAGHVMSLFNGAVPKRPFGDWSYWTDVVPGDTSATLWTQLLSYKDLPKVIDPPSDWVQNSNSSPWFTTFPQVLYPDHYPPYIAPQNMNFREQRGVHMLMAQDRLSFDQVIADKFSTHMELADRILDQLISAARTNGDALANQAADVLQAWDRTADANSKGSVLFYLWVQSMSQNGSIFAVPWDAAHPTTTPSGLADPQLAVQTLDQVAQVLLSRVGSLDVPWGTVFRLQRGTVNLPASGGPGDPYGIFRALYYTQSQGQYVADAGDSYIAVVQFSTPIQAKVLLTYGNSSQPDSPHNGDQLALYAKNQMRTAWLTLPDITAHLSLRQVLS